MARAPIVQSLDLILEDFRRVEQQMKCNSLSENELVRDSNKTLFKTQLSQLCDKFFHMGMDRGDITDVLLKYIEEVIKADIKAKEEGLE